PSPPQSRLFPYTTLFRSAVDADVVEVGPATVGDPADGAGETGDVGVPAGPPKRVDRGDGGPVCARAGGSGRPAQVTARRTRRVRSEEHTSELQSLRHLVC